MQKPLFRDTKNGHIAGVSSGLGIYLNLDPVILRIIFLLLVPTGGLGVIIYLALWILIPEAKSTSDRIRMEGKRVNIKNIEDKVKEETDFLKDRLNDFSEEARDVYKKTGPARRQGLKGLENFFKAFGKFLLRVLKILLGFVLLVYGVAFLVGFAILQFNWVPRMEFDGFFFNGMSLPSFLNTYVVDTNYAIIAIIALSFVIFIPIVMMIFHGIRFLFNLKRNKTVGAIAWQSWLVALIVALGLSYTTFTAFQDESVNITKHDFKTLNSDTLSLRLNTNSFYADVLSSDKTRVVSQDRNIPTLKDGIFYGEPRLRILSTEKEDFHMKLYLNAYGKSEEIAEQNIQEIDYHFSIDSLGMIVDPYFMLKEDAKWRNQDVDIRLYIPENKAIMLDRNIRKHFRLSYPWARKLWDQDDKITIWYNEDGDFNPNPPLKEAQGVDQLEDADTSEDATGDQDAEKSEEASDQ